MRIISLDFNDVTKMYFIADGGNIYTRQVNAGERLESVVNNVGMMVGSMRKIKLRIYPGFPEEDLSRIKELFSSRDYKRIIYERYTPPKK